MFVKPSFKLSENDQPFSCREEILRRHPRRKAFPQNDLPAKPGPG